MEKEAHKKLIEDGYPVLCANKCGFFGSTAMNNLCSKCYKDYVLKQSKLVEKNKAFDDDKAVEEEVKVAKIEEGTTSDNPPSNRCSFCRKRVGLTGFKCRCGQTFCSIHRYSDKHNCAFDYKSTGQNAIAKENPIVKADKIKKI